ncbi:hypothetical protein DQ356_10325 [Chryseobacterium lacus]|uniref:Uncharacterized protein n=1 Tax=Chryseobacterium lacus TaxID=2058346 RepID=A0A368MY37_9FLAO|nr:hypothetical protein DQ356_10325 [Chryseobacterium lacus]
MTMQFHSRREKKCFIKTLKKDFESKNQIEKEGKVIEVFYLDENTEIWMIQYNTTNMIEISYGPIKYIRKKKIIIINFPIMIVNFLILVV